MDYSSSSVYIYPDISQVVSRFLLFALIVLVGDPHAEVPDVEDSTPSPADVPHDPQDVASLCPRHHGMVDQRHVLPLHTTPPDIITPPSTV